MEDKRLEDTDNRESVVPPAGEPDEKIECDEVLTGSESAEITEKTDSSDKGTDEKVSPMQSESTSGIETKSESLRSPDQISSLVSTAVDAASSTAPPTGDTRVDAVEPGSPAGTLAEKTEVGSEISPPEKSKRGSLVRGAMAIFKKSPRKKESSPTEKTGMLSRFRLPKSISSPEKPLGATAEEASERDAACATPEDETFKKGTEKKPVLKRLAKTISSVFKHKSGSGIETEGLVTDQDEPERTPATSPHAKPKDQTTPEYTEVHVKTIYWTEGRQSLTQRPSLSLTEKTDLPSTFTGTDVFLPSDSRRPSEAGENTSEEAIAGSLASSLGDIKEIASDKDEKSLSLTPDNEKEFNMDNTESKAEKTAEADVGKEAEPKESTEKTVEADVGKEAEPKESTEKTVEADLEKGEPSENPIPEQDKTEQKDIAFTSPATTTELEQPADADKTE